MSQGGPLSAEEARVLEEREDFQMILAMRRWDDLGKDVGIPVGDSNPYRELCGRVLQRVLKTP